MSNNTPTESKNILIPDPATENESVGVKLTK